MQAVKALCRSVGVDPRKVYHGLLARSLRAAIREQKLGDTVDRLRQAVPDLSRQYTYDLDADEYERVWELKMRGLHAFQIDAALDALDAVGRTNLVVADIGDSSGAHAAYLKALDLPGRIARFVSVNLDPVAVEKVRARGGEAVLSRAEDLHRHDISPDLVLSFETLEHLTDPLRFIHGLHANTSAEYLLFSVPYRRTSRFGGALLRLPPEKMPARMTAEMVHVYEFSPEDWALLSAFGGFRPVFVKTYRQYPRAHPLRLLKPLWRRFDFEGFTAICAKRDPTLPSRYTDW